MKDRFKKNTNINNIEVFDGYDNMGYDSMCIIFKNEPNLNLNTEKIFTKIIYKSNEYRLFISLNDNNKDLKEIFDILKHDLLKKIENLNKEDEIINELAIRFNYWSELLIARNAKKMDENKIQGILGELFFINEYLIDTYGSVNAIKGWVGPSKSNQDFIFSDNIFEVKTVLDKTKTITISNKNQLSIFMNLIVITFCKSGELSKSSFNLSKMIMSISDKINDNEIKNMFYIKLAELGILKGQEYIYDDNSYEFLEINKYFISEDFPFIDHKCIPFAVSNYKYDLLLSEIDKYKSRCK
ncbi:hypothetical protein OKW22_000504 [Bacilli bacterium PM5-3]|nr:hypothetical protein [Bacilli bacterium PM5-3]MDH6604153.1 hypothetical protein [Bacilli bacterium PM5-9]